jgi:hypothetical protein
MGWLRSKLGLDQHPGRIWWVAGPLAGLGFGLGLLRAALELKVHHDPWYLVIYVTFVAPAGLMFYKMAKTFKVTL